MTRFIRHFGTHYSVQTNLGAMLIYEKRYTSSSRDSKQSQERKKCSEWSANGCMEAGGKGGAFGFSASTKTKACLGYESGKCQGDNFEGSFGDENNLTEEKIRTVGSFPGDFDKWAEYLVGNPDNVVPIK